MFNFEPRQLRIYPFAIVPSIICLAALMVGCGGAPIFSENRVFIKRLEVEIGEPLPAQGLADVETVLVQFFGSADQPVLPEGASSKVVSLENLQRAAGRVYSDENDVHFGLYRNNCIRCHGTSGDGRGPAARLLSPYPRDFRLGKYKFKSTPQGDKPAKTDLERTIRHGIPGTSMPSFALLSDEDIEALVDYVIYLSFRGETEREMLRLVSNTLDYSRGDRLFDVGWQASDPVRYDTQVAELAGIAAKSLGHWHVQSPQPPVRPTDFPVRRATVADQSDKHSPLMDSIARGDKLFRSNITSCSKCHGEDGTGKTAPKDYDLWTKDWTLAAGIDPEDKIAIRPLLKAGALKPVQLYPRNLRHGVFRGGEEPEDLYLRIVHGIEGTSMPAAALQTQVAEGLTTNQVWDLVNYVLSLAEGSSSGMSL